MCWTFTSGLLSAADDGRKAEMQLHSWDTNYHEFLYNVYACENIVLSLDIVEGNPVYVHVHVISSPGLNTNYSF